VNACGVRASDYRGRVEAVSAQGPVIRVVCEDGAVSVQLADERCRVGGPGQLRWRGRLATLRPQTRPRAL